MSMHSVFNAAMQKVSLLSGNNGNSGNKPEFTGVFTVPTAKTPTGTGEQRMREDSASVPSVPTVQNAGTTSGNAANPHGSKLVPAVPTVPAENEHTLLCPLRKLNVNGFFVEPHPTRGLLLTADYHVSESLRAHVTLWALGQWEALLTALFRYGEREDIPRRVEVTGLATYPRKSGGAAMTQEARV